MATTTNYSWSTPDDTALVKDGASAIRTLGSSVDTSLFTAIGGNYAGLRLVKKQTIGTGVSSVTVTNAFSATYDAYRIVLIGGTTSVSEGINFQLGPTSVSQYNTQYYQNLIYSNYSGAAPATAYTSNASSFPFNIYSYSGTGYSASFDLFSPFLTRNTEITGFRGGLSGGANTGPSVGFHNSTNSFSGFQLLSSTGGTFTGGTIYVYGYGAS